MGKPRRTLGFAPGPVPQIAGETVVLIFGTRTARRTSGIARISL
jgi:hypothetical protein